MNHNLNCSKLCTPFIAIPLFFTSPVLTQTINEDVRLTSIDGMPTDLFGSSIAVDAGVIAVGAPNDDNGKDLNSSGSAYLFNATTGEQLFKLLPDDPARLAYFGNSIAMDAGIVAVGAYEDDDNGFNSGSVYLFDAETGFQLAKLLPTDGQTGDRFGISVAIDNGIVAVGADKNSETASNSGSAYLFDATTGEQLHKLLPNDGAENDFFGFSIDINNALVVVGSLWDDDNGENSGSVYIFDATTGTQINKITPSDGIDFDRFGDSVSIDNDVIAVGASQYHFSTNSSGAVYLFDASTGLQTAKLVAGDAEGNESFGFAIAMSEGIVAVGALLDNDNGYHSGSAYIFDADTGEHIAKLLPSDGSEEDKFGNSIAINDGMIAIGANQNNLNFTDTGLAYRFSYIPTIDPESVLGASDGQSDDSLGTSVAIQDNIIVTGAVKDDDNGSNSGSAFILDAITGNQLHKLLPSDGAPGDRFGNAIDIDGDLVIVGSSRDDDNGAGSGSAYLFDSSTGLQIMKLLPDDGEPTDNFGFSIAIDNQLIAIGAHRSDDSGNASGSAYIFDATTGIQLHKLLPNNPAADDQFGYSIDIQNGIVAVGAINNANDGIHSGSAYLFDAITGIQIHKLYPTDRPIDAQFGSSIAIHNNTVAVGANHDSTNGTESGSAYLFDTITGNEVTKIIASDGSPSDFFGSSIALSDTLIAVGAWGENFFGDDSGSAYLFDSTTRALIAKYRPNDGSVDDRFGYSIAIDNGLIASGATNGYKKSVNSGAVYILDSSNTNTCPSDLNKDNELDFFDISAFLTLYAASDPAADFNDDAAIDFFDISAFLTAFTAGCP